MWEYYSYGAEAIVAKVLVGKYLAAVIKQSTM